MGATETQKQNPTQQPAVTDVQAQLDAFHAQQSGYGMDRLQQQYEHMNELENLLFGPPKGGEQSVAYQAWERVKSSPGNELIQKRVMLSMTNAGRKVFEAAKTRLQKEHATEEETKKQLSILSNFIRTTGVMGQTMKVFDQQYVSDPKLGTHDTVASGEVMDSREGVMMDHFTNFLDQLDAEELVKTIEQDQVYIDMLVQSMNDNGPRTTVADVHAQGERTDNGMQMSIALLGLNNPAREQNYARLIGFAFGEKEAGDTKEKSQSRKMVEVTLWLQIVTGMNIDQKGYLVERITYERGKDKAKEFIENAIRGGAMTKMDVQNMRIREDERIDREGISRDPKMLEGTVSSVVDDPFLKKLDDVTKEREKYEEIVEKEALRTTQEYIPNAATHFLTMNKIICGRLMDLGVLTAGLNWFLTVTERLNKAHEHHDKTVLEGVVKGTGEALKNKWFWFGVGEIAAGTEGVFPWMKGAIHSPSANEREHVAQNLETRAFHTEIKTHPAMYKYFHDNFNEYLDIAEKNKKNINPKQNGKEDRGTKELYPGDVVITPKEAGELGYKSVEEATIAVHALFNRCMTVVKTEHNEPIDTQDKLQNYYLYKVLNKQKPKENVK